MRWPIDRLEANEVCKVETGMWGLRGQFESVSDKLIVLGKTMMHMWSKSAHKVIPKMTWEDFIEVVNSSRSCSFDRDAPENNIRGNSTGRVVCHVTPFYKHSRTNICAH